jgi:hypothetical protein
MISAGFCRSCGNQKIQTVLDLGEQPWCNDFLTEEKVGHEEKYPLTLVRCEDCKLLQLDHTIPKETMFGDHDYLSGMTQTLLNHFYDVAKELALQIDLQEGDLIVDIGGNDGSQLIQYQKLGFPNVVNVESSVGTAKISEQTGVRTINNYFDETCAVENFGENSVRVYNASGVFFHLEELHSVIRGIKKTLHPDGVLLVQFMYAGAMLENSNFDTIYHEHLCYYTIETLGTLLKPYGLELFDAYYSDIHSGSIITKITHSESKLNQRSERLLDLLEKDRKYNEKQTVDRFATKIAQTRHQLRTFLEKLGQEGKTVYAYGAPAKGNTLLNYYKIDSSLIQKAVEINPLKVGKYLPGSHIPIAEESPTDRPDYYLLLSHNFAEEIIEKNKALIESGVKFIIPFPTVEVVG